MRTEPDGLPPIGTLANLAYDDLRQDAPGWLLAGLAFTAALYVIPVLAGIVAAVLLVPVAFMGRGGGLYAALMLGAVAIVAALATMPFFAGLYRSAWDWLRRGDHPSFGSVFRHAGENVGSTVLVSFVFVALVALGSALLLVPGLIAAWLLMWALPLVFLHRRDVGSAISGSVGLARRYPSWTIAITVIGFVLVLVAASIPVLGTIVCAPVWVAFHARAFESAFGSESPPLRHRETVEHEELPPHPPGTLA